MVNHKSTQILLLIGLLASVITGIGEYMLHFLPVGPGGEVSMLNDVPLARASKGHFISIIGAPLYIAGYYGLKKLFETTSNNIAYLLFAFGTLAFFIGGIWISSRYFGAEVLQRSQGTNNYEFFLASYESHYQVLVWALRVFVLAISVTYITLILKNKIGLPKWLAISNPILLLLFIFSTLVWFKPLGIHIAPIAMNVAHFIFFGLILIALRNTKHFN